MYCLAKLDDAVQSGFWVILNITSDNLCKPFQGIMNYSTFICPLESGRCGNEGEKYKKLNILRTKGAF